MSIIIKWMWALFWNAAKTVVKCISYPNSIAVIECRLIFHIGILYIHRMRLKSKSTIALLDQKWVNYAQKWIKNIIKNLVSKSRLRLFWHLFFLGYWESCKQKYSNRLNCNHGSFILPLDSNRKSICCSLHSRPAAYAIVYDNKLQFNRLGKQ